VSLRRNGYPAITFRKFIGRRISITPVACASGATLAQAVARPGMFRSGALTNAPCPARNASSWCALHLPTKLDRWAPCCSPRGQPSARSALDSVVLIRWCSRRRCSWVRHCLALPRPWDSCLRWFWPAAHACEETGESRCRTFAALSPARRVTRYIAPRLAPNECTETTMK